MDVAHACRRPALPAPANGTLLAFAAGTLLLQQAPVLPAPLALAALALPAALLAWARRRGWPLALWLGLAWFSWHAAGLLAQALPATHAGVDLVVTGTVASLPSREGRVTRFEFAPEGPATTPRVALPLGRLRLAWYGGHPPLRAGDRWQLHVRLKPPRGFRNPGGFDYAGWMFRQGLAASGYVRDGPGNARLGPARHPAARLQRLRQRLADGLAAVLGGSRFAGILAALALGERQSIDDAQWRVLRVTGTSHLVAISGLHVGLVAALCFALLRWAWSRSARLALRVPAPVAAAWLALPAAAVYAALAGFTVPTQRALVMTGVVLAALVARRGLAPGRALLLALAAVTLYDPLAAGSAGFWLSFLAVAAILYTVTGRRGDRRAWRWLRVQLALGVLLAPVLALQFQLLPLLAPLANLVAVPLVGVLLVPLVLSGTLLLPAWPALGGLLLRLAEALLELAWPALAALAQWPWATLAVAEPPLAVAALGVAGALLLLAPGGLRLRLPGLALLLPLFACQPPAPAHGSAWVTLFDVGQGLAAAVRTRSHLLLFDTGPAYSPRFDGAAAALLPFVRRLGRDGVDLVVVSHGDGDHAGGLQTLRRELRIGRLLLGGGQPLEPGAEACRAGQAWQWDGVDLRILHPGAADGPAGNDGSCVLRVEAGGQVALLTGDIEAAAEGALLAAAGGSLRADLLQVPHHGSTTSSTPGFVARVAPRLALVANGFGNRFGLPDAGVVARYRGVGARVEETAAGGALEVRLGVPGQPLAVHRERQATARFWHAR